MVSVNIQRGTVKKKAGHDSVMASFFFLLKQYVSLTMLAPFNIDLAYMYTYMCTFTCSTLPNDMYTT